MTSGSQKDDGACHDGDFVRRLLAGDESAFSQLVADNYAIVHAIAFARLYDTAAADDLAQEVFLRVFLGLPQLQNPAYLKIWISRIARNLAGDWARKRQVRSSLITLVPLDMEVHGEVADNNARRGDEVLAETEMRTLVNSALGTLSVQDREILLLRHAEQMSPTKVAEALGIHRTTVLRRSRKALERLRRALLPQWTDPLRGNACRPSAVARATALIAATHAALGDSARAAELTVSARAATGWLENTGAVWTAPAAWLRGVAAAGMATALLITGVALLPADGSRTLAATPPGTGRTQSTEVRPAVVSLKGWWNGEIDGSQIWYNLRPFESGGDEVSYAATMDFGEVIIGMNVSDIVLNGDRLRLHTLGQCIWEGEVSADQMTGTFTRLNGTTASLVLRRMENGPAHKRRYRKEVMLDPQLLTEYEGVYRFGPRTTITISRHSNRLYATCTGQETMEIYPEAKDEFFYRVIDTQFTFKRDRGGKVSGMIMHQAGMDVPSRKEQ